MHSAISKPATWLILIFLSIAAFFITTEILGWHKVTGSRDLRNRIVGSRLLSAGHSPYYYKWQQGDPVQWADPSDSSFRVTRATVPPAMLLAHAPLNKLSYEQVRNLWLLIMYILVLFTIFLFYIMASGHLQKTMVLMLGLVFLCSPAWQLHVNLGQIYILYAFLFAFSFYLLQSRRMFFLSGILLGLVIVLRPPALIFIPVLLFFVRNSIFWIGVGLGLALTTGISLLASGTQVWSDYFMSMREHALEIFGEMTRVDAKPVFPGLIENSALIDEVFYLRIEKISVQEFAWRFMGIKLYTSSLFAIFFLLLAGIYFLARKFRKKISFQPPQGYVLAFCIYILLEFFLPAQRIMYNSVQWIFPLMILLVTRKNRFEPATVFLCLGLLLYAGLFQYFPTYTYTVAEIFFLPGCLWSLLEYKKASRKTQKSAIGSG